jgi:nucleoside-diphosphate-sugar epimerase
MTHTKVGVHPLAGDLDHILDHTGTVWDELRGARLFITGGTGFFGRWLLETLVRANERLGLRASAVVLTRDGAAFRRHAPDLAADPAISLHAGDVARFGFPAGGFSHVLHMGSTSAVATFNHEPPLAKFETIVHGTQRTLEFAVRCGARRFLYTSSGVVYGPQPADMTHVPEEYRGAPEPTDPAAALGHSKRAAEFLVAAYGEKHGFGASIARCFSFIGPHLQLDVHYAIGNFLRDALRGRPIEIRGDGTPRRSYLYSADMAIWLLTILCKGEPGRSYNVGSEEDVTIAELARRVARQAPSPVDVKIAGGRPPASAAPDRYVPSTRRARLELGLQPTVGLDDAIARTIRALQKSETGPSTMEGSHG